MKTTRRTETKTPRRRWPARWTVPAALLAVAVGLVALALLLPGCSGVTLSAEYSELLDETAAVAADDAARANAGTMTPAEMAERLAWSAWRWQAFRDARDGKASAQPPPAAPPEGGAP